MSPGYAPFAAALDLPAWLCDNCGFWQRYFEVPSSCPLCLDARHVVPADGWMFHRADDARAQTACTWTELEDGVWRFANEPAVGIGPMGYLIRCDGHNVAFESCGVLSDAALDHVAALGGVDVAAASHPHAYGALWQLQDRFDCEIALHPGDLAWSGAFRVTWPYDDELEIAAGLRLHHTAGHFAGHAVLHDAQRRILFCGDALKFELDPADERQASAISAHKAFVRGVPLTHGELRRYRDVFATLVFEQTWTPFEQAANAGREAVLAFVDGQLCGRPSAAPVQLHAVSDAQR
jgi:hypothetical protein